MADDNAWEALLAQHSDDLRRFVTMRVGTHLRRQVDPDDIVQETYARACRCREQTDGRSEATVGRWLRAIAEHVILEEARKSRRRPIPHLTLEIPDEQASPATDLRRDVRFDRLQAALDRLPAHYREVVILSRIDGLRIHEIASRLGRTSKSVAHLLTRAITLLQQTMEETESFSLPARELKRKGRDTT